MKTQLKPYHRQWPAELFTFSSHSRQVLIEHLGLFKSFLISDPHVNLKDIAYSLNTGNAATSTHRLAFVASTAAEAAERAASALDRVSQESCKRINDPRGIYFFEKPPLPDAGLAFLFPGEGSQYAGMLAGLCLRFPQVRACFDRMDRAFIDHERGSIPSQSIFPLQRVNHQVENRLWQTDGAVEAVFTASQSILALLDALEIYPNAVVGHSAGDYSALSISGVFHADSEAQFVRQARALNSIYEELSVRGGIPPGVLLAVNSPDPTPVAGVIAESKGALHLALDNCPHQMILCGTDEATTSASEALRAKGAVCEALPFARAYHTPLFEPLSARLYELLQDMSVKAPSMPVYSCVTGKLYPPDPEEIRKLAAGQWSRPVRFRETIEEMYQAGLRVFVEVGPRSNLTAFVDDILRGRPFVAVPCNIEGRSDIVQIQHLVAQLFAAGAPMRLDEFYARREATRISLERHTQTKVANSDANMKLALRLPTLKLSSERPQANGSHIKSFRVSETQAPAAAASLHTGTSNLDSRTGVLKKFFENTHRALDLEREVMAEFLAMRSRRNDVSRSERTRGFQEDLSLPASPHSLPFVRQVISIVPGREVTVLCEIDLSEDLFLRHHTLGGKISATDENLVGLPVVPLTVTMEILAETASLLAPEELVVGMRDVLVSRWLTVEHEQVVLDITAQSSGTEEVRVELWVRPPSGNVSRRESSPAAVGTVVFASRYPQTVKADSLVLSDVRPSKWRKGQMYSATGMFHGPLFQVVSSMDFTGKEGAQATFTGAATSGFFKTKGATQLIDPVTLDAMGQIVGYWIGDRFENGLSVFPFRLARLELFRPALEAGERAECRLHVLSVDDQWIRSDIDVVTNSNDLYARMTGWEDRRLDLPRRFYDFRISPADVLLSDSRAVPIEALPKPYYLRCTMHKALPPEIFEAHGGIWLLVLGFMVLNETERRSWQGLRGKRRREWLLSRIAAKDAVRLLLRETVGLELCPADIEIVARPGGGLRVEGQWILRLDSVPGVSTSGAGGLEVAVAGLGVECSAIGLHMERVGGITGKLERFALSDTDQSFLTTLDPARRAEWVTRLWCAKKAVRKALGLGALAGATVQLDEANIKTGRLDLSISLQPDCSNLPHSSRVPVYTTVEGKHAFGIALVRG